MKTLLPLLLFVSLSVNSHAGTFTSLADGSWATAGTWTAVGDADGIPDNDDDVTIQAAHNVSVSATGHSCRNLVVDGIITLTSASNVNIWGNYTLNGSEAGVNGSLSLKSTSGTISGAGTFGPQVRYSFVGSNYTISSEVNLLKSIVCSAGNGTIINNGYVRFQRIYGNNANWINNSGSTLEFSYYLIDDWNVTLNASAVNNTVIYSASSGSHIMKDAVANTYYNLTFSGSGSTKRLPDDVIVNGTLTLNPNCAMDSEGFDIYLRGNFVKPQFSGSIIQDAGTVINFDGTSAQTITSTGQLSVNDIVFNNATSVSFISGFFNITNSMTVTQGTVNLGNSLVTLLSTATKTAYIGQGNGTFSGNMNIQRYIDARIDGYSDMSSPVSNATFAGWLDDMYLVFSAYVPYVTEPSAWGYDESIWDYVAIETSTTAITPGMGYEVYLANDGDTTSSFSATTLDLTGTPNYGDIPVAVTVDNDGWNLVGNPYASFIDWTTYSANAGVSMNSQFLYYDESIEDFAAGNPGDVLAPGQGFWIECTTAGSAIFHENNKVVNTSSSFRNMNEELFALRVSSKENNFKSNTYFRFDESASLAYEANHDLSFLKVPHKAAPSLFTLSSEGKRLRINELAGEESMSIPVMFIPGVNGSYTFSIQNIQSIEMAGYNSVMLEDKQTGIFHDLKSGDYDFDALLTDNEDRFIVHLKGLTISDQMVGNEITFTNSAEGVFANFNLAETESAMISVFNVAGQEISNSSVVSVERNRVQITLPEEYHGIYIIRVIMSDKMVTQRYYKN